MTQSEPRQKPEAEATSRKLVRSSQAIVRWVGDVLQITTPGSDRNVETEGLLILRILGEFSQPALAKDVVAKFPKTNPQTLYEAIDHLVGAGILLEHCEELAPAAATSNTPATSRKTLTVPADLLTSDVRMPMSVVFPAPFGPSSAKKSSCSTSRSTPRSA